jgi:hypothetical protein
MSNKLQEKRRLIKQATECAKRIEALLISVDARIARQTKKAA